MAGAPAVFLNPQAHSLRATCPPSAQCSLGIHDTISMLLPCLPIAVKILSIAPNKYAKSFLLVVNILTTKTPAIGPLVLPHPVDLGILPLSPKLAAVLTKVLTIAIDGIVTPASGIGGTIWPMVHPVATLLAEAELTFISCSTLPHLHPIAMLQVFLPLAAYRDAPVGVDVLSYAMGSVVLPVADENIAIGVNKFSWTFCQISGPKAGEPGTIFPHLGAKAMTSVVLPLTSVDCTSPELIALRVFELQARLGLHLLQLIKLSGEVATIDCVWSRWP